MTGPVMPPNPFRGAVPPMPTRPPKFISIALHDVEMANFRQRAMPCEEDEHDKGEDSLGVLHYGNANWYIRIDHRVCCQVSEIGIEIEAVCDGVVDWIGQHADDMFECKFCNANVAISDYAQILGQITEYPAALG